MAKPCTPHLIAQRVQLFKPQTGNGGVKGQRPLRSLGGQRGPFSHVREWPPLFNAALGLQYSSLKREIFQKSNEILFRIRIKQMHQFGIKPKLHRRMPRIRHRINIRGGNDCHNILPIRGKVQMQLAAHQLADVDLGRDTALAERDMHGAHARGDTAALDACGGELCALLRGERDSLAHDGERIAVGGLCELAVFKEIHLRRADEARDEQVRRMVEDLLRRADLLDVAVAHDDDAVAEGHGLDLIVRDVDERGVNLLAQLDDLRAHLVAQLRVEVRERLVHQQHLGASDDGAADGHALALAAGERLGLAVEELSDVEDFGRLAHATVDLVVRHFLEMRLAVRVRLRDLLELEREGNIFIDGHVRIKRIVLEDHRDVAVFGRDVVHLLAVDEELAAADLLETGDHAQRGRLAAAARADEHDELLVGHVDVEVLHGDNAFVSDLQIVLLFDGLVFLLFLLAFGVGVDLSDIFQNDLCHNREPQSCRLRDAGPRSRLSAPLYGRSPHCRTAGSAENVPPFVFPASGT